MAETYRETVLEATGAAARIAKVYAQALMATAAKARLVDAVGDELDLLAATTREDHPQVREFFASAMTGKKAKGDVLAKALKEAGTSELLQKFIGVLQQNGRLQLLRAVQSAYQAMRDKAAGRVRVKVTTAAPLSDAQVAELSKTLAETLKAEPVLDARVNPDLLGGLVVQVGDKVYDTSVRTRLDTLRTHLMASGTYGSA
jgi:F-type H+-transporting ATPase subunit delta